MKNTADTTLPPYWIKAWASLLFCEQELSWQEKAPVNFIKNIFSDSIITVDMICNIS